MVCRFTWENSMALHQDMILEILMVKVWLKIEAWLILSWIFWYFNHLLEGLWL